MPQTGRTPTLFHFPLNKRTHLYKLPLTPLPNILRMDKVHLAEQLQRRRIISNTIESLQLNLTLAHLDQIHALKNSILLPLLPFSLPLSALPLYLNLVLDPSLPHLLRQPGPIMVKRHPQVSQPLILNKLILHREQIGRVQHPHRFEPRLFLRCHHYSKASQQTESEGRTRFKEENWILPTSEQGRRCVSKTRLHSACIFTPFECSLLIPLSPTENGASPICTSQLYSFRSLFSPLLYQ